MKQQAFENNLFKNFAHESFLNGHGILFNNFSVKNYTLTKNISPFSRVTQKIFAIPSFLCLSLISVPIHTLQCFFHGIPEVIHGNTFPLKKYVFTIIRDLQGCIGRILLIFSERLGLMQIELSKNFKKYYDFCDQYHRYFLTSNSKPQFYFYSNNKFTSFPSEQKNEKINWIPPKEILDLQNVSALAKEKILSILKYDFIYKQKSIKYCSENAKEILCQMMQLPFDTSNIEIKKHYKKTLLLIHPDKIKSELAIVIQACQIFNEVYKYYNESN